MFVRVIFFVIFHFVWRTLALQCLNCDQTLNLINSSETINTKRDECILGNALHSSCSEQLYVQYGQGKASVRFESTLQESLVLSNLGRMMINTTMIWLNKFQFDRIFQNYCFDNNTCKADLINNIYIEVQGFQYTELWANLLTRLYDATINPENLVCADNQEKSVPCPYGFCQLISNDHSTFSSNCIHNHSIHNPYGVEVISKTISEKDIQSSLRYTCNKPMCNNLTMAKEIRHLLEAREVLMYTTTTTTTTTTVATTITNIARAKHSIVETMVIIHCGLIFLITFIF